MKNLRSRLLAVFSCLLFTMGGLGVSGALARHDISDDPNQGLLLNHSAGHFLPPPQKQSWSSWIAGLPSSLAQRLRTAAGGGRRDVVIPRTQQPEQLAIWTAPMPIAGQLITSSLNLSIRAAITPAWSADGNRLACSKWVEPRWLIAVYTSRPSGEFEEQWRWVSPQSNVDFSPMWSPDENQMAFIRQENANRSDIWILQLGDTAESRTEQRLTNLGNVRQLFGWDAEEGILYETQAREGNRTVSRFWSWRMGAEERANNPRSVNLSIPAGAIRGRTPARTSSVYAVEFPGGSSDATTAHIFEFTSAGQKNALLPSVPHFDRWPDVTSDGRRIAFTSNRPQGR